jgi:exodeoxyribonuclease V gamma subunit
VLYLSYIGRDALDDSAREPSVVVSELLDVAATYFDDATEARKRLVVHHALQPFGKLPDADARRVRFDPAWAAALRTTPTAHLLPAFVSAPLAPDPDAKPAIEVDYLALRRFLIDPPRIFLRDRLGLRLDEVEAHLRDAEPFVATDALERFIVHRRVFDALLADASIDEAALCRRLQAEAELPPGAAGTQRLREIMRQAQPIASAVRAAQQGVAAMLPIALQLGDVRLGGALADVDQAHAIRFKVGKAGGRDIVRWHLDSLVLSALGEERTVLTFAEFDAGDVGPRAIAPHPREAARDALRWLVGLMREGHADPLSFRPSAAWAWFETIIAGGDVAQADEAAAKSWTNRTGGGEGSDAATALALRGAVPFVDEQATTRFRALTRAVFAALLDARVPGGAT